MYQNYQRTNILLGSSYSIETNSYKGAGRGRKEEEQGDRTMTRESGEGTRDSGVMKEILGMSVLGASFSAWWEH